MPSIITILDVPYVVLRSAGLSLLVVVMMIGVHIKISFVVNADKGLIGAMYSGKPYTGIEIKWGMKLWRK